MKQPGLHEAVITTGFWADKTSLNAHTAIFYQWEQLEKTRCIDNFRIAAGLKQGFREGFFFADSDAYKWLDAAARILSHSDDPKLTSLVNDFIGIIEKAQEPDGYLYTYNQFHFAGQRWVNLQVEHEFYCLGHLIEAGISHFEATRSTRLLAVARKAASLLVSTFLDGLPDFTDGHEEIEVALIKLWRTTGVIEYLALAKAFLEKRGTIRKFPLKMLRQVIDSGRRMKFVSNGRLAYRNKHPEETTFTLPSRNKHRAPLLAGPRFVVSALNGKYNQQNRPVIQLQKAEGHAVRFCYLQTAQTMLARETGDANLIKPLKNLWEQMVAKRMYVTGGVGSLPLSEGFGRDYEIDPEFAYAETCAALGSMFWSHEMLLLTGEPRFGDLFEWQLYNAASVGVGQDGCSYFYNNPMVSHGDIHRAGWYDIPCCPSNVSRTWASLGSVVLAYANDEVWICQFVSSETTLFMGQARQPVTYTMTSTLPWQGNVTIKLGMESSLKFRLAIRLPAWAEDCVVNLNGSRIKPPLSNPKEPMRAANGLNFNASRWMVLEREFHPGDEINIEFEMPIRLAVQDKRVPKCGRKLVVTRGPVVYCLESLDNAQDIFKTTIKPASLENYFDKTMMGGTWTVRGKDDKGNPLVFIPYMLWGNRGQSRMTLFVNANNRNP